MAALASIGLVLLLVARSIKWRRHVVASSNQLLEYTELFPIYQLTVDESIALLLLFLITLALPLLNPKTPKPHSNEKINQFHTLFTLSYIYILCSIPNTLFSISSLHFFENRE